MTRSLARRPSPARLSSLAVVLALVAACAAVGPGSPSAGSIGTGGPAADAGRSPPSLDAPAPTAESRPRAHPRRRSRRPPRRPRHRCPPRAATRSSGQLGSYTWGGVGSDSPWLPGAPIAVGAREPLAVTFAGGPPVARWTARRARAGATSPVGAVPAGGGTGPIAVDAPASGSWTLAVTVEFAGGIGSATWYWRLDVR